MKRILKITLIALLSLFLLLAVLLTGGYFFIKNYDISAQKPGIVELASKALKRGVDFSDIDLTVSLTDGIHLQLKNLTVAEDPDFGSVPFARVDSIDARLDLLAFIKFKKISMPDILISHPDIRIIRDSQGGFNFSTIAQQTETHETTSAAPAALPALLIKSLKINNGSILVSDLSTEKASDISLNQIDLDISDFSLTQSFPVILKAALAAREQNLQIRAHVQLDLKTPEVNLTRLNASLDSDLLDWKKLSASTLIPSIPLPQNLGGIFSLSSDHMSLSNKGITQGALNLSWNKGLLVFNHAMPGISIDAGNINLKIENYPASEPGPFSLSLTAALFQNQSNIDFHGSVLLNPDQSALTLTDAEFKTDLSLWDIAVLKRNISGLQDLPQPERLSGKLTASIKSVITDEKGLKSVLADITLTNSSLLIRNLVPDSILNIADTNITIKNLTLDKPFTVSLTTGLFTDVSNISFDGSISYDTLKQTANILNGSTKINLDRLQMNDLQTSGLIPADFPLPEKLKGLVTAGIQNITLTPRGLTNLLMNVEWQNGVLVMKNAAPGVNVSAEQIHLKADNVSLDQPFDLQGSLAYENTVENIRFKTTLAMNPADGSIRLTKGTIGADLSLLPMDRLRSAIEALKDTPLPDMLAGRLDVNIHDLSAGPDGLGNILADISLNNGRLHIPETTDGISLKADHINAQIKDFSLSQPFTFTLNLAYLDPEPNIFILGTSLLDLPAQSVKMTNTTIKTDLAHLSLNELQSSIAALKNAVLPEMISGHLDILVADAVSDAQGLKSLNAKGTLTQSAVKLRDMPAPLEDISLDFNITEKDLTLRNIKTSIGDGHINAMADISNYTTTQNLETSVQWNGIHLNDILDQKQAPVKIEGALSGDITLAGMAADLKTVNGSGTITSRQTRIRDLNILKMVLDKLSFLPNASRRLQTNLPVHYQEKLKKPDTDIQKAEFTLKMVNGKITINPTVVEADEFLFNGITQAGLDQSYLVKGTFKIPAQLAAVMAQEIPELQYLFDAEHNISLPVNVHGQGANPPTFAVEEIARDVTKSVLTNMAQKQLIKLLGGSSEPAPAPASGTGQTQPLQTSPLAAGENTSPRAEPEASPDPAEELINDLFGSFLKKKK